MHDLEMNEKKFPEIELHWKMHSLSNNFLNSDNL